MGFPTYIIPGPLPARSILSLSFIKKKAKVMVIMLPSRLVPHAWKFTREFRDKDPGLQMLLMSHVAIGSSLSIFYSHPPRSHVGLGAGA